MAGRQVISLRAAMRRIVRWRPQDPMNFRLTQFVDETWLDAAPSLASLHGIGRRVVAGSWGKARADEPPCGFCADVSRNWGAAGVDSVRAVRQPSASGLATSPGLTLGAP